ncbi:hypothetical protein AB0G97_19115 [Streptomyces sp. NPDC020755]|uniref:hypothetical protein n=1 Tax=unclassified Streptomyces TaxID=2593676 RepID=UPI00224278A4|nr:hypothetical protein [Streptomyces sp. VB1]UZI30928.1 hypothetical protein OH133_24060 [Streptomyces sp. VB1]
MITEPELVGEPGPDTPADVVSGFDPGQGLPAGGRRRARRLLWAAAGAVVASAVWASAVFAYGIGGDRKPDPRGYRVESDSCAAVELRALARAVGEPRAEPSTELDGIEHPALHRIRCTVDFTVAAARAPDGEEASGWSTGYQASVTAELHKETDPRPEFEASSTLTEIDGTGVDRVERVPDLGDLAYLLIMEDASMRVQVVEGGFVVTLALSSWMSPPDIDNGTDGLPDVVDQPEMLAYRADLISDTREVMKALKTG